jgi:hypothetical protein
VSLDKSYGFSIHLSGSLLNRNAMTKNLKRVRLFKTSRVSILPSVRQELIQDQGIARSIFIKQGPTQECESLVPVEAIVVTVLVRCAEISLIDIAVAET